MKYGRKKSTSPPTRDHFQPSGLARALFRMTPRPKTLSYRYQFPPVQDQGDYGTCVANATAGVYDFFERRRASQSVPASRRALYAKAKQIFTPGDMTDDGLETDQAGKVWEQYGYVSETVWPYPPDGQPEVLLAPVPFTLWRMGVQARALTSVEPTVIAMKMALAKHGPLLIGLAWPQEWENAASDGTLPVPYTNAGGHCVVIVGYDDGRQAFEVRNSWGVGYGEGGYVYLPYALAGSQWWPDDVYTITA